MSGTSVHIIGTVRHVPPFDASGDFEIQRYENEIKALQGAVENQPQIILLHYIVRLEHTASYIDLLLRESPASKIVIIGKKLGDDAILDMLTAGAMGYMEQGDVIASGNKMLLALQRGEAWIGREMVAKLLERLRQTQLRCKCEFIRTTQRRKGRMDEAV